MIFQLWQQPVTPEGSNLLSTHIAPICCIQLYVLHILGLRLPD